MAGLLIADGYRAALSVSRSRPGPCTSLFCAFLHSIYTLFLISLLSSSPHTGFIFISLLISTALGSSFSLNSSVCQMAHSWNHCAHPSWKIVEDGTCLNMCTAHYKRLSHSTWRWRDGRVVVTCTGFALGNPSGFTPCQLCDSASQSLGPPCIELEQWEFLAHGVVPAGPHSLIGNSDHNTVHFAAALGVLGSIL